MQLRTILSRSLKPLRFGPEKLKFSGMILMEFGRNFFKSRIQCLNLIILCVVEIFDVSESIPTIKNSNKTLKTSNF